MFQSVVTLLTSSYRRPGLKIGTVVAVAATVAGTLAPLAARADQLANDQAEAQYLASRISSLGVQEAALGEQYDAGTVALAAANQRVAAASRQYAAARGAQSSTVSLLQQDAVQAYIGGSPMSLAGNVPANNLGGSLLSQELAQTFASEQSDALDNYRLAADNAVIAERRLTAARNADKRQLERLRKARDRVQSAQDQLMATESQVKGDIATLVARIEEQKLQAEQAAEMAALKKAQEEVAAAQAAAAQARREAAIQAEQLAAARRAAALAQQAATTTTVPPASSQSAGYDPQQIPGVSAAASVAVQAAESRLGDPYVWGASGPGAFDCSGLVMWAYAQAGVYLPHYSGAQFADTTQIPMSDLEPGDLVFPSDPGEHVAIYVGNGDIIEAPYTGADVHIIPLSSFFVFATRVG